MTIWWLLTIISIILLIIGIFIGKKQGWDWDGIAGLIITIASAWFLLMFLLISIAQPISLKQEQIRQEKERQQIIYQIDNLNENSDKVKLNEWILNYNDWVNDVNTNKEMWGWFSWHYYFDMSGHTIINLV